jgi:glyoxylase-like metal-dependent hydrolase (beta-lactamase superfamily II)
MKLFFHYCTVGFSNCYVIGTDYDGNQSGGSEGSFENTAVIIDPGNMDDGILNLIEAYHYRLRAVLITHGHQNHCYGIRALKRIYDFPIYAAKSSVMENDAVVVQDGDVFNIGSLCFNVYSVPGHSADSVIYAHENILFTGDALSAGLIGSTSSSYAAITQTNALQNKILNLPGNRLVMPGHGPPSSLDVERKYNAGIKHFNSEVHENHRKNFNIEFLE